MEVDRQCNECGETEWNEIVQTNYPERRQERNRTIRTVLLCDNCGAEGRHFDHQDTGTEQYSGALR
jgi:uncharacterized Zn finger protein